MRSWMRGDLIAPWLAMDILGGQPEPNGTRPVRHRPTGFAEAG
jgi:hypothetical protein